MTCFTKCQPFHKTTPTAEETRATTEPHRLEVKLQFSLPGKLHALVAYGKKNSKIHISKLSRWRQDKRQQFKKSCTSQDMVCDWGTKHQITKHTHTKQQQQPNNIDKNRRFLPRASKSTVLAELQDYSKIRACRSTCRGNVNSSFILQSDLGKKPQ